MVKEALAEIPHASRSQLVAALVQRIANPQQAQAFQAVLLPSS
ncbi:hypothetical protein [Neosynechococcus sphagnicola]|nr:hypothetical protein [Neosynechococcus sphagnicola]